jgi:hypothetical protein
MKRPVRDGRKYLHHTSAEGLLSKMGKAVSKLNNKEIT